MIHKIDSKRLREVIEIMCDDYCKWPKEATSDEQLEDICSDCPLNNINNDDYPLGRNDWQE